MKFGQLKKIRGSWTLVFLFITFVYAELGRASVAELTYRLLVETCENSKPEQLTGGCSPQDPISGLGIVAEDAHLGSLADMRSRALSCASGQLANAESDPNSRKQLVEDIKNKIVLLSYEKQKMEILLPAMNRDTKAKEEYKNARLRAEAIISSIPFVQTSALRQTVNGLSSIFEMYTENGVDAGFEKTILQSVEKALKGSAEEIKQNKKTMEAGAKSMGVSLSDSDKESLAQDTDLIEAYRQQHKTEEELFKSSACRVDAKYGRGAQYRDFGYTAATILATGGAAGLARVGGGLLASSMTGAAAMGTITVRAAAVLRVVATTAAEATSVLTTLDRCESPLTLSANSAALVSNRCEPNIIKEIASDNCILESALALLGTVSIAKGTEASLKYLRLRNLKSESKEVVLVGAVIKNPEIENVARLLGDEKKMAEYLKANGSKIKMVRPAEGGADYMIDGVRGQYVSHNGWSEVFMFEKNGDSKVLKLIHQSENGLGHSLREYRNALIAEKLGGPKVSGFGIVQPEGKSRPSFYIEMEQLFPHQQAYNSKTIFNNASAVEKLANEAGFQKLANSGIGKILEAYREGVIPRDPQFLVSEAGKLRWIDAGEWRLTMEMRYPASAITEQLQKYFRLGLPIQKAAGGKAKYAQWKSIFTKELQRQIEAEKTLSDASRKALLDYVRELEKRN